MRITNDSDNIIKEIRGYSHKTDKNGRVLEEPVKFNDHLCVGGETKISTTHGDIPIKELVKKTGYVYSYSINEHRICVRDFFDVIQTGYKKVLRIVLDDRKEIFVTPGHPFLLRNEEWKVAADLQVDDRLMPFYQKVHGGGLITNLNNRQFIRAHRLVYQDCIGDLPDDSWTWNVHHKDGDILNNDPSNLWLVTRGQHASLHRKGSHFSDEQKNVMKKAVLQYQSELSEEGKTKRREHLAEIRGLTKEWHKSEEGRLWHKEQGKKVFDELHKKKIQKTCIECGKVFDAVKAFADRIKCCSSTCRARVGRRIRKEIYGMGDGKRRRLRLGLADGRMHLPFVTKLCMYCGEEYEVKLNLVKRSKFCSASCQRKNRGQELACSNHRIASIEDYGFMDVYNMQVRDTNNFVGNGIVLHNCDSIRYALYTHALSNIERSDVSIGFM